MHPSTLAIPDFSLVEKFISHVKPKSGDSFESERLTTLDGPFLSSFLPLPNRNDASRVLNALEDLRSVEDSLTTLLHITKEGVYQLGPSRKIMSLPFEIIAIIFEIVFLAESNATARLSLVCKSFRKAVLNMPRLWTDISNKSNLNPQHYLERSKSIGIDVEIFPQEHCEAFMLQVAQHASRWKSVSFRGCLQYASLVDILRHLRRILPRMSFSALETLNIIYYGAVPKDANNRVIDDEVLRLFGAWDMPVLRRLDCTDLVPVIPSAVSLTCIRLTLYKEMGGDRVWNLQAIANCLGSSSSLKELVIRLDSLKHFSNAEGVFVDLRQLETLDVGVMYCENQCVEELMGLLSSTPNVKDLTIKSVKFDHAELEHQLGVFFPRDKIYWPHLETFDLTADCFEYNSRDDFSPLENVFSRLPKIQHLSVSAGILHFPADLFVHEHERGQSMYPPLRTMCLRGCTYLETGFILGIQHIIDALEFEKLEITRCPLIDAEAVREIIPAGKVFDWKGQ